MVKKGDLDSWAVEQERNTSSYHNCHTCGHEQAAAHVDELLAAIQRLADKRGRNNVSLGSVYRKLLEDVPSYGLSQAALSQHLRRCRPEAYQQLWSRR